MTRPYTIVIKLGSSSLVDAATKEPKLSLMSLIVETVVALRRVGHRVIIVSSGCIAVGLKTLGLERRPKHLADIQAVAAVGQGRLIGRWDKLFSYFDQRIAQVLLTRNDIAEWSQYKNAKNTLQQLLDMGVVPVVNENDTIAVSEIHFGDNDSLSAITAALTGADYLFLLTDVDCLYTDNPRTNLDAKPILVVPDMAQGLPGVNTASGTGSDVGTGGMQTKLVAAELAVNAGVHTIIMNSESPSSIFKIVQYIQTTEGKSYEGDLMDLQTNELETLNGLGVPLHTKFIASEDRHHLKNREFWMLHGLVTRGSIVIDVGAYAALTRKEKAGLLPAGVIDVEGTFQQLQCVDLKLGRRLANGDWDKSASTETVGRARCNYTSTEVAKIRGMKSDRIEEVLGYSDSEYVAHRHNLAFPPH